MMKKNSFLLLLFLLLLLKVFHVFFFIEFDHSSVLEAMVGSLNLNAA